MFLLKGMLIHRIMGRHLTLQPYIQFLRTIYGLLYVL
jgi:hypothetical protein